MSPSFANGVRSSNLTGHAQILGDEKSQQSEREKERVDNGRKKRASKSVRLDE